MADESFANDRSHVRGRNTRQSHSRNYRSSNRGGPRRPWRTPQHREDNYFCRDANLQAREDEQFPSRQVQTQYFYSGNADDVHGYADRRYDRRYDRGYNRYRGNSSRHEGDRYLNENADFGNTNGRSDVDRTVSSDNHMNGMNLAVTSEISDADDSKTGSHSTSNKHDPGHASQVKEEPNKVCDQRGFVVGGRYMRRNPLSFHAEKSSSYGAKGYCSSSKTPERLNYRMNCQENTSYSRFPRNGYSGSFNRESQSERRNNPSGRQKHWHYGIKTETKRHTPDLGDNVADFVPGTESDLQNSCMQNEDSKAESKKSYLSSYQNEKNLVSEKRHVCHENRYSAKVHVEEDEATQKDRLILQLEKAEYECMVCCESVRCRDHTWHCSNCYHVFHLRCIRKWARSPAALIEDSGWRCPACQNSTRAVPYSYYCFCGKRKDPEVSHHLTPHSCGEVCGKQRPSEMCPHRCNILCHPGPCPPCTATITVQCGCGKIKKTVPCRQQNSVSCGSVCNKILNCGAHHCERICHVEDCDPCSVVQNQICFCGKLERQVPCTQETSSCVNFTCDAVCGKKLTCGHHYCEEVCHPGPCAECAFLPSSVDRCPCGRTPLKWLYDKNETLLRKTCIDPVPVCDAFCNKVLKCGPKENPHVCKSKCHSGECPPCPLTTVVKCRCGSVTKEQSCIEYVAQHVFLCEKRCTRRKDCGRHKCLTLCCIGLEHVCELVCNRKLSCGLHHCEEKCHMGNCPPCKNVSFDELTCYCGTSVIYPPIHCGTKPPECKELCTRRHRCDHEVHHTCHNDETCPPCTVLTVKWCFGKHMQRKNVQCFLEGISCGLPCDKPLPCNVHKCKELCHEGPCLKNSNQCTQPCSKIRPDCDHPCNAQCHEGPCPDTPCKAKMSISCPCGNRSEVVTCSDNTKAYHLVSVSVLASKIQDIKLGQSVNMSDVLGKKNKLSRLQCNEECAVLERNKRLAVALQIQNPDLSCKPGPPNYSEFLKDEAKKSPQFVFNIYDKLADLVQLAKESKKKSRSYAFPPMNRDQRRIVHELAEFFGCESQSYDEEPKKSVTVTSYKDKSWLPFVSLMAVVQREMGQRKGPVPVISRTETSVGGSSTQQKERTIDYFDFKQGS